MSDPPYRPISPNSDYWRGALLGMAVGEALGRPIDGLSHQNVRTFFKGVKGYAANPRTDVEAGAAGPAAREAARLAGGGEPVEAAVAAALLGEPSDRPLARLHAAALQHALSTDAAAFDPATFWTHLEREATGEMLSALRQVGGGLDLFPLDLADACGGTEAPQTAWLFGTAMFARNPHLVDATLLSAVNVGGLASIVGGAAGSLLGALNGWRAFPAEWRNGLVGADELSTALGG